jgi:HEAT repeat protein
VGKAPSTEEALLAIRKIRDDPDGFDLKRDLAPFLTHKSNHVIAAAADTVTRLELGSFCPELVDAFLELMKKPDTRDQGCKALIAIAKALATMDQPAPQVYFAGIRHVQKEGSFGPPVDAAAPLRGLCAQGLVRMSHPDALLECVTLLADTEIAARAGAVRALGESGQSEGMLLLRLKALLGDDEEIMIIGARKATRSESL